MKKILISDKLAEAGINYLNEQAESGIKIHIETGLNEEQLCNIIGEYDALINPQRHQSHQKSAGSRQKPEIDRSCRALV